MIYFTKDDYFAKMLKMGYVPSQLTNDNATYFLNIINEFINYLFREKILPDEYVIELASGWRSVPYNLQIGGAKHSNHIVGRAIDIKKNDIIKACEKDQKLLERFGLYAESSLDTTTKSGCWSHIQDVPPASGHRIFRA